MVRRKTAPPERSKLKNVGLFKDEEAETTTNSNTLALTQITLPDSQPRRYFDPEAMTALIASIKSEGILQPLLVRPQSNQYQLVAGERRYRAAQEIGLTEVPVIVKELSDSEAKAIALTENLQREELNPLEETEGIIQLLALRLNADSDKVISLLNQMANVKRELTDNVVRSQEQQIIEEVFNTVTKLNPESFRVHRLPLLNLPTEIKKALEQGKIAYTKAKAISKVKEQQARKKLLDEAIKLSLSLNQIKEKIAAMKQKKEPEELQARFDSTYKMVKKNKKLWQDSKKKKKLQSLLTQLEKLIET